MQNTIIYLLPEIIISIMACVILIIDLFISKLKRSLIYYLTQTTLLILIFISILSFKLSRSTMLYGAFIFDYQSVLFKLLVFIGALIILVYSKKQIFNTDLFKGEFFVLCLLSILGMMIMISRDRKSVV